MKKAPAQLQREINEALAKPSAKARREATVLARKQEVQETDTTWRRQIIDLIRRWAEANEPGAVFPHKTVVSRLTKLDSFIRVFFPEAGEAPLEPDLAAALLVLPRRVALQLARRLFGAGPGIAHDLQAEDLTYNMDWFAPKAFSWSGTRRLEPLFSRL